MIKVFTTGSDSYSAGDALTLEFEKWVNGFSSGNIRVINFHTNSNKYGWCLTVHYEVM